MGRFSLPLVLTMFELSLALIDMGSSCPKLAPRSDAPRDVNDLRIDDFKARHIAPIHLLYRIASLKSSLLDQNHQHRGNTKLLYSHPLPHDIIAGCDGNGRQHDCWLQCGAAEYAGGTI